MKKYLIVVMAASLSGCMAWYKDGASQQDFGQDKYVCLQEAQQGQSSAQVNRNGGAAQSGAVTNNLLFNSCMEARGWALKSRQATTQQNQQNAVDQNGNTRAENVEVFKKINEKYPLICGKPDYAAFFLKSPCDGNAITIAHLVDNTKINQEQKDILLKWRSDMDAVKNERNAFFRNVGSPIDKRWADYVDSIQPEIDKYNMDFYNGVTTWGEYNQLRKNFTAKMMAAQRSMYQPAK